MSFRDRFFTAETLRAVLSWRLIAFVLSLLILALAFDVPWVWATVISLSLFIGSVLLATPRSPARTNIDPFAVGEPWRQFVKGAQRSATRLRETIETTRAGPLQNRLVAVADKLDHGLEETFRIARRGDEIDAAITRLDPTALRSKLQTLELQRDAAPNHQLDAAIDSVVSQLASTDRLKEQSAQTASTLRLTQTRLDELVSRAAEISVGSGDTDVYEHDVDDLVVELEGLRLAVEETNRQ